MFKRRNVLVLAIAGALLTACDRIPLPAANDQGGAYIILEVDAETLQRRELDAVADQMTGALREAQPPIRYVGHGVLGDAARVRLAEDADWTRANDVLQSLTRPQGSIADLLQFNRTDDGFIEARLTPVQLRNLSQLAANQSVEVIRRRLDPTGLQHVEIVRQGYQRIFVRAPQLTDLGQLRRTVGATGMLSFHLVREVSAEQAAAGRLPIGAMAVAPHPSGSRSGEIVERRPRLTGDHLVSVAPATDAQTGEWVLRFQLDSEGARIFCRLTREHTGERFAVLLDNQVLTAPTINEPICAGSGQISGNFTPETVREIALLLGSGALPVPLRVVEEGVLPPD
jgi:protein-export membrane protein SecD